MPECKHPDCDVVFNNRKWESKKYCCAEHYRDHQKILRKGLEIGKGNNYYGFIDEDLKNKYSKIDEKIMNELYGEDDESN
jgi:hypothetical protein